MMTSLQDRFIQPKINLIIYHMLTKLYHYEILQDMISAFNDNTFSISATIARSGTVGLLRKLSVKFGK